MKKASLRTTLLFGVFAVGLPICSGIARAAEPQSPAPAATSQGKDDVQSDASLRDSILVVGNRYQAAAAQTRAVNTINVLSADDLSHTAVHNVAEALALLPAVSTTNTGTGFIGGVDAASRGEAMYAQVRGMDSAYSLSLINGVNVAEANPYSRNVQLNLLPPSGLSTIVLNLTATADQESDFISGAIDFHTPSAYDFAKDHLAVTMGAKLESEALAYGNHKIGQNFSGEWSKQFGDNDQFGIYAQAYYDVRYFTNGKVGGINETHSDHAWGYAIQGADPNGGNNSAPGLNPVDNIVMAGVNESVADGQTKRYGGSFAFDFRPSSQTKFFARFTYARADSIDNVANSQIIGQGTLNGNNGMGNGSQGVPLGNGTYGLLIPDVSLRYWFITNPQANTLATSQIGGETSTDHLTFAGSVFFSSGVDNMPNQIQVATRNEDNNNAGTTFGGSQLFSYNAQNYPIALLNTYQQSVLNNIPGMPAGIPYGAPELTNYRSSQSMAGIKGDVTWKFDAGVLKFVKAGFKVLDSWHQTSSVDYQINGNNGGTEPSNYTTFGSLGLISNTWAHAIPGLYSQPVPNLDVNKIYALYNAEAANPAIGTVADDCGGNSPTDSNALNCNTTRTLEHYRSGYVMGDFVSGNFEVIPGVRYEGTWIRNTYWVIPNGQEGAFQSDRGKETVWLPSLYVNYRPTANAVYRAAVWTSYIRPPFVELGAGSSESVQGGTVNGVAGQIVTITKGNPNLKPVQSVNFDTSAEWTSAHGGHLMVQLYAKSIRDYIYDAGNGAGNYIPTANGFTTTIVPVNGGHASVEGFDIEARQRFEFLPAPFDGLGVSGNMTLQHSHVNLGNSSGNYNYQDQIANTPSVLGNLGLFFRKNGYSIDLNYNYQGAAVQNYDWFGIGNSSDDVWTKAVGRVDLHLGREFNNRLKLDVAVSNLLNATTYFAHVGRHNYAESDIVFSGVTGAFNLTYKY